MIFMKLKNEKKNSCEASFFDLSMKVYDGKFTIELFDEINAFSLCISRMPYLDSNLLS